MSNIRYSTTGEVTIAIRKHINRTTGEVSARTGFSKDFANYVTSINPVKGTSMTLDQIVKDLEGWDGQIEVTKTAVKVTTVHLVQEPAELESEPVVDDVEHLDDVESFPALREVLSLSVPVDDEDQADAPEASGAVAPESTRGRTNAINTVVHGLGGGVTNGRRIESASVHTVVAPLDRADEVVAAVLQLGWAGLGADVDGEPTPYMQEDGAGVKVRVRVPDVDEDGQPLRRFDEVVEAAPVEEPVAALPELDGPIRIDVPEGYQLRSGSSDGVWWIDLFRETGEVEDEVHVGSRRNVPQAEVQAVVDELVKVAEEAYLAELTAEVALYKASQVDDSALQIPEVVHPEQPADLDEGDDLDEITVDDEIWEDRVAEQSKRDAADVDPVFGLPLEPDYIVDPRQGLPVLGVDHVVTIDDLVPGQAIERVAAEKGSKVRTLAPCCGRFVPLPVTAGLYAPVACGWSCKMQYLVTRLFTNETRTESVARFVVLGPTLVVSQYYPGRGKKAS